MSKSKKTKSGSKVAPTDAALEKIEMLSERDPYDALNSSNAQICRRNSEWC